MSALGPGEKAEGGSSTYSVRDDLLHGQQPGFPLSLVHPDAPDVLDLDRLQRVLGWKPNGDLHCLLVDDVRRRHLVDSREDLDRQTVVLQVCECRRLAKRREFVRDDVGRKVARRVLLDRERQLTVFQLEPPCSNERLQQKDATGGQQLSP